MVELPDKRLVPVAGDFDLSSWVTEEVRPSVPREYHPELPAVALQARYEVEQIKRRVSELSFLAASNRFSSIRTALESQIAGATLDEPGRTNALHHIIAFFDALTTTSKVTRKQSLKVREGRKN